MREVVAELLSRYPPPLRPVEAVEWLGNSGGSSGARLWRYRSGFGSLCLRAWPENSLGRPHLEQVHRWLAMARGLSFIPVPLQSVDGHSLLEAEGTFWELSPWMPGAADRSRAPGSARIAAAFGALATFHRALEFERVRAPSAGLIHRCKLLQNLDRGGLSALRGAIENAEDDSPERRDLARQWLSKSHSVLVRLIEPLNRAACEPLLLQPCLRDARGDHLLFTDDRLTAIVDFGAMGVDCVATDLARLMGDWLPADGNARSDALAAYDRIRPLDPAEIAVLDAFESSADLLIGESWLRWHYLEKQRFSDPRGAIEGIRRGVARLERRAFEMGSS